MTTSTRIFSMGIILALILSACTLFSNPGGTNPAIQPTPLPTPVPGMSMTVNYDTSAPYNTVGQEISFSFLIGNTSGSPIPGPVTVTDDRIATVTCPDLTLVGNQDTNLDTDEALSCTGTYAITQLDLDAGSVTNIATATAGGYSSLAVTTAVPLEQKRTLTLTKSPDPQAFNSAGEAIIYSYVITNSGNVTLGPVQFTITDDKVGPAFNCGTGGTILAPTGTVNCSATYLTTEADVLAGAVVNNAFASDGTTISETVTATVNKGNAPSPSPGYTPGETIQHQVVLGEWLWQIARCYGADPRQVILANSQLANPAQLSAGDIVTVPDIGSERAIFGPQQGDGPTPSCVPKYTIQSGDTWASIASKFTASPTLLQSVNPGIALSPGNVVRVPINSVGDDY